MRGNSAGWRGYGDTSEHEHELPRGEKQCKRGCDHDSYKMGHKVTCDYPGCNMTLGRICGGCGGVY